MRQITLKLSSVCFALALALCSVLPVFAEAKDDADADTLTINKEAQIAVVFGEIRENSCHLIQVRRKNTGNQGRKQRSRAFI